MCRPGGLVVESSYHQIDTGSIPDVGRNFGLPVDPADIEMNRYLVCLDGEDGGEGNGKPPPQNVDVWKLGPLRHGHSRSLAAKVDYVTFRHLHFLKNDFKFFSKK